ncbi:FAD-dependent monooxygenase [Mycobacteroides salmoniphilum]|uniref:FAD-dependent monooxygenase n=1 Tax=Mycobacteroides salmoniphilum TaxID=404941 RepID=UPI0009934E7C|nr:FAD-dependent monooxygenase [Mycobacteroides salmoniphilum]
MTEHAVVVVGGGPTGLMLAGELALAGVDVAIVERRTTHDLDGSRAGGMTSRTLEVLDQRGIVDRFLPQGFTAPIAHFSALLLDMTDLPTRHTFGLALLQYRVERTLSEWVGEHEVPIYRGRSVTGFTPSDDAVDVELSDGSRLRAQFLVGCDGGRSLVRKIAGIGFPGWDPSTSCLVADVQVAQEPEWGIHREGALHSFFRFEEGGPVRVLVTEPQIGRTDEPTLGDLSEALAAARGTDYGIHSPTWISRFSDVTRQAATYREGRVLLAGDAAHVHFPIGGQGLNTGVQDAVNLGWKLAQVVNGTSHESLLDTYHAERHPVAARVLHNTMAQTALSRAGDRVDALRDIISELLTFDAPRHHIAAMMSGLDIHYDLGDGHPILGRRMPDLDVLTNDGMVRVFTLLHDARGVLLNLGAPIAGTSGWSHRVDAIDAEYVGVWDLPAIGVVDAPQAILIRPDGYVAWVGDGTVAGLNDALHTWFGPPRYSGGGS